MKMGSIQQPLFRKTKADPLMIGLFGGHQFAGSSKSKGDMMRYLVIGLQSIYGKLSPNPRSQYSYWEVNASV